MRIFVNPSDDLIRLIIEDSRHKAAKWVRSGSRTVYFRPEDGQHAYVAKILHMQDFEKGIAVL